MVESTLVIFKPSAIQRHLVGEVLHRFERKGLLLSAIKMIQLSDTLLNDHYSHLQTKSYFKRVKDSMMSCPVIVCCLKGVDAVSVVRSLVGDTNGRLAKVGTIRGDYSMSHQENIVHASDSVESAQQEINRFFKPEEIHNYNQATFDYIYANDEYK